MLICLKKIDESVFGTKILIPPEYILVSKLYGIIHQNEKRPVKIEIDGNDGCRYRCYAELYYIQSLNRGWIYFKQDSKLANVLKKVFSVSYKYVQDGMQIPSNRAEFIALYSKEDESDVLIAKRIKREDEEDLGSDINRDLGIMYFDLGSKYYKCGNKNAALDYFSKAAEREIPEAQNNLGAMYYEEKASSKYKKNDIINILKKAAGKGIVEAQFNLGNIYYNSKDYNNAIIYYKCAAKNGYAKAQYNLGVIYHYGIGDEVQRSEEESKKWFAMCPDLKPEIQDTRIATKMKHPDKIEELDPQVEHKEVGPHRNRILKKGPKTGLCIHRKDGSILQEHSAAETFTAAIVEAGVWRVRSLNLKLCHVNIVSTTKDKKYGHAQRKVESGLFVITHCSTDGKKKLLEKISKAFAMDWNIEIVK